MAKGVIDQADDVFYLYRDELVDALLNGGDRRRRRGRAPGQPRARRAGVIPPGAIGTPPPPPETPDPFMDAIVTRLLGMVPPEENLDPNVLRGVSGSPRRLHGHRPGGALARRGRWTSRRARSWCAR